MRVELRVQIVEMTVTIGLGSSPFEAFLPSDAMTYP
jgi:hypothetical protein